MLAPQGKHQLGSVGVAGGLSGDHHQVHAQG
jgi:hypothetical protein